MVHLQATRKVLDASRIEPRSLVTERPPDQLMHDWYVTAFSTGHRGKTLLLYFHEPSMMMVITKGRTIASTFDEFQVRLTMLLERTGFPEDVIIRELRYAAEFVAGKTSNRSMLSSINQVTFWMEYMCGMAEDYGSIDFEELEDLQINNLHDKGKKGYETARDHWEKKLGCKLIDNRNY